jgi:hypothetical protein
MSKDIQKVGGMTDLMAVTTTSAVKALTVANSLYLILENVGSADPIFVTSGTASDTITFPTTSAGQRGAYLKADGGQYLYKKNNPNDTHLIAICTGTGSTLVIQAAEGN